MIAFASNDLPFFFHFYKFFIEDDGSLRVSFIRFLASYLSRLLVIPRHNPLFSRPATVQIPILRSLDLRSPPIHDTCLRQRGAVSISLVACHHEVAIYKAQNAQIQTVALYRRVQPLCLFLLFMAVAMCDQEICRGD